MVKGEIPPKKEPHDWTSLGGAATVVIGTLRICGCGCRRWYCSVMWFNGQWEERIWRRVGWWQFVKRWRIWRHTR